MSYLRLIDHWRTTKHVELVTAKADDDDDPLDAIAASCGDQPEVRAGVREIGAHGREIFIELHDDLPVAKIFFQVFQRGVYKCGDWKGFKM